MQCQLGVRDFGRPRGSPSGCGPAVGGRAGGSDSQQQGGGFPGCQECFLPLGRLAPVRPDPRSQRRVGGHWQGRMGPQSADGSWWRETGRQRPGCTASPRAGAGPARRKVRGLIRKHFAAVRVPCRGGPRRAPQRGPSCNKSLPCGFASVTEGRSAWTREGSGESGGWGRFHVVWAPGRSLSDENHVTSPGDPVSQEAAACP